MIALYILIFSVVTLFVSILIGRSRDLDQGKIATYITLIAWGSLVCGLCIAKVSM